MSDKKFSAKLRKIGQEDTQLAVGHLFARAYTRVCANYLQPSAVKIDAYSVAPFMNATFILSHPFYMAEG